MMDSAAGEAAVPRAFLKVGAGTVARHQLALALALDCTMIVCLVRELSSDIVEIQHRAEQAGARFHAITGPRALVSLVTASDEVVVLADGLLAAPQSALPLLESGNVVLVQPVESGTAAGFERIDFNHAAAGLMRIPGRLVERLAELEPDCDTASSLMRVALQAGISQRLVPAEARDGVRWSLVRSEGEASAIEAGWIALHNDNGSIATPTSLLARLGVKLAGPAILHAGSGGNVPFLAALAVDAMAFGLGWFGWTIAALVLGALAWVGFGFAAMLRSVERASLCLGPDRWPPQAIFAWFHDLLLVAVLALNQQVLPWIGWSERIFIPLILLCIIRLVPRALENRWIAQVEDRAMLGSLLALACGFGVLNQAMPAAAAALGIIGILLPGGKSRLTRV
ncbi:MAG: hypothetical protein AB7F98_08605 [Novosphingobium sp.]